MKRFFLLGLTALGLIALAPTESKADDGFRIYISPGYPQDRPYYYGDDRYPTTVTRTNIGGSGGTGTIIGTITIENMIETTTGIEAYEIITFCSCAGLRRIDFSIL